MALKPLRTMALMYVSGSPRPPSAGPTPTSGAWQWPQTLSYRALPLAHWGVSCAWTAADSSASGRLTAAARARLATVHPGKNLIVDAFANRLVCISRHRDAGGAEP